MKTQLVLIVWLSLATTVFARSKNSANPLSNLSTKVRSELIPFLTDSTEQIILNPSKATFWNKEFLIWNRQTQLSGLKKLNDQKIFFNFSFNSAASEKDVYFENENKISDSNSSDDNKINNNGIYERIDNNFSGRLVWISENGKSFGILGAFSNSTDKNEKDFVATATTLYKFSPSDSTAMENVVIDNTQNDLKTFGFGFEFNTVKNDFEWLNLVWLERENSDLKRTVRQDKEENIWLFEEEETLTQEKIKLSTDEKEHKNYTNHLQFSSYLKNKLDWFANDFGFLKVSGKFQAKEKNKNEIVYSVENFKTVNSSVAFDRNFEGETTDFDTNDFSELSLSFGYVLKSKSSNLDLMFGLVSDSKFFQNKSKNTNSNFVYDSEAQNEDELFYLNQNTGNFERNGFSQNFTPQIHIDYEPEKWISIYGGMTCSLAFSKDSIKNTIVNTKNNFTEPEQISNDNFYDYNIKNFSTANSIYSGFILKHKSGFRFDTIFNGNILSYRNWLFKLSYHY
ncbi:hypothetical protein IT568_08005 [bacterium]|nr:hypothetical protein [bacterium]